MIAAGAVNLLAGLRADQLLAVFGHALPQFGNDVSLGILGGGAQVILGAGLLLTGAALFWRLRVAWTFAILLLLITVGVNLSRAHFGSALIIPCGVLLALVFLRRYFWRRTVVGSSLMSAVSVIAVLAYGTFGIYLLGAQFDPAIETLSTALYFLVETLSTTGYGDYAPVTPLAQGFMVSLWVVGLGVFASALVTLVEPLLSKHLNRFFGSGGERPMKANHVILAGSGVIAGNTANELLRRKMDFVQVVADEEEAPLQGEATVHGDASEETTLRNAGIGKARMLIAAHEEDGDNAFISLAAKDINPELEVLVVASSRRAIRRLKLARADRVFAPAEVGSRLLVNLVEGEDLPPQFDDLLDTGETPA